MKKKRRKKNVKRRKALALLFVFVLIVVALQYLTKPQWKNGNTEVIIEDTRGVHEQTNNYAAIEESTGVSLS